MLIHQTNKTGKLLLIDVEGKDNLSAPEKVSGEHACVCPSLCLIGCILLKGHLDRTSFSTRGTICIGIIEIFSLLRGSSDIDADIEPRSSALPVTSLYFIAKVKRMAQKTARVFAKCNS
jgi:hypothetical protein